METRYLKLSVQNFGPVAQGEFELKPLTIFIGPNNSGKSYMAVLVHALTRGLAGSVHGRFFSFPRLDYLEKHGDEILDALLGLRNLLREKSPKGRLKTPPYPDLPPNLRDLIHKGLNERLRGTKNDVDEALRDYFGCDNVGELIKEKSKDGLSFRLNEHGGKQPLLAFRLTSQTSGSVVDGTVSSLEALQIPDLDEAFILPRTRPRSEREMFSLGPFWFTLWRNLLSANEIPDESYYLPAGRSGILQGWPVLASLAVEAVRRRVGFERVDIAAFSGVAGDFLQVLLEGILPSSRSHRASPIFHPALEVLESRILQGEVVLDRVEHGRPRLLYKTNGLSLPLQRTSSMVGEVAPFDIWIKHFLRPGSLLIIDEPEAHLHPENQRRIATVLVRLAKAGVRVLCTTHSSLILHQVSNHLLASEADPEVRAKQGYAEQDLLKNSEAGVYLFDVQRDGTHITPVPIEPGFGISEDEFVHVAESIGEETYRLSSSLKH